MSDITFAVGDGARRMISASEAARHRPPRRHGNRSTFHETLRHPCRSEERNQRAERPVAAPHARLLDARPRRGRRLHRAVGGTPQAPPPGLTGTTVATTGGAGPLAARSRPVEPPPRSRRSSARPIADRKRDVRHLGAPSPVASRNSTKGPAAGGRGPPGQGPLAWPRRAQGNSPVTSGVYHDFAKNANSRVFRPLLDLDPKKRVVGGWVRIAVPRKYLEWHGQPGAARSGSGSRSGSGCGSASASAGCSCGSSPLTSCSGIEGSGSEMTGFAVDCSGLVCGDVFLGRRTLRKAQQGSRIAA